MKERINVLIFPTYSEEKVGRIPRAGFEPTSPCILVRRVSGTTTLATQQITDVTVRLAREYPWGLIFSSYKSFPASKNAYLFGNEVRVSFLDAYGNKLNIITETINCFSLSNFSCNSVDYSKSKYTLLCFVSLCFVKMDKLVCEDQ